MQKETLVTIVIAVLVGFLGGFLVFNLSSKSSTAPAVSGGGLPPGSGAPVDYQRRIVEAEKVVAADPKNLQAWIQLGNDYFDTEQPQKAIAAYNKVLELDPKNANVLTDQGVMYRKMGWFDKALANFEKAQQVDPRHEQSLINMGVVYVEDLKQPEAALKAWNTFLERFPTSPMAPQVRSFVEQLKGMPAGGGKKK